MKPLGALFLDYTGMTVNDINAVRRKFQESGITYQVVKNTLMARACADTPYAGVAELLKGSPTGVVLGGEDAVSAAKLTFELLKDYEALKIKGGILDDAALDAKQAEALSKMPSRQSFRRKSSARLSALVQIWLASSKVLEVVSAWGNREVG